MKQLRMPLACLALVAATSLCFWNVLHSDFVYYDDHLYVTLNPFVHAGLTLEGVRWALTSFER